MWGWRAERDCHGHSRRIEHLSMVILSTNWNHTTCTGTATLISWTNLGITGENWWFERYSLSVIAHIVWINDIYSSWQAKHLSLEIIYKPFFHGPVSFELFLFQKGHIASWSQKKPWIPGWLAALAVAICLKNRKTRLQLVLGNLYSLAKGISVPSVLSLILAYWKWEVFVNRG